MPSPVTTKTGPPDVAFVNQDFRLDLVNKTGFPFDPSQKTHNYVQYYYATTGRIFQGIYSCDMFDLWIAGLNRITTGGDAYFRQLVCEGSLGPKPWLDGSVPGLLGYYGGKQALRIGVVDTGGPEWDDVNIGLQSVGIGLNVMASGPNSFAFGSRTIASAAYAIAFGDDSTASGIRSIALGSSAEASAESAFALGPRTISAALRAIVLGCGTTGSGALANAIANSLSIGFLSNVPTFFIGPSADADGTVGNIGAGLGATLPTDFFDIAASVATRASLRLRHGTAPTGGDLRDGQVWTTSAGMFVRVSGTTVGPLAAVASRSYGELAVTTAAATTIVIAGTFVKASGTTTLDDATSFDQPVNNRLRYTGATTKTFRVTAACSVQSAAVNAVMTLRLAKNGTTISNTQQRTSVTLTTTVHEATVTGLVSLALNDYLEVFVTADSTTTVTLTEMNMIATEV